MVDELAAEDVVTGCAVAVDVVGKPCYRPWLTIEFVAHYAEMSLGEIIQF